MDAELKAKWTAALRSGKYQQARGTLLLDDGSRCCLGVLCEVAGLKLDAKGSGVDTGASFPDYRPIFEIVGGEGFSKACSARNDGHGGYHLWSFSELADYIEQNL